MPSSGLSLSDRNEIEHYFRSMNFRSPILPHTAVSGFIFTNQDEGEKVVQVDLIAAERVKFFTFFVQIPGMRVDYRLVEFEHFSRKMKLSNWTKKVADSPGEFAVLHHQRGRDGSRRSDQPGDHR